MMPHFGSKVALIAFEIREWKIIICQESFVR